MPTATKTRIVLYQSGVESENQRALDILQELEEKKGFEVAVAPYAKMLDKFFVFPAIDTPEGFKHSGLASIEKYVRKVLEGSNGNGGNGNGKK